MMKPPNKLKGPKGKGAGGVRRDRRLKHGLYSKAVRMYLQLDRDVRNCENPTPEMYELLGMALVTALATVSSATDVTNRASHDRYLDFLKSRVIGTRKILGEEAKRNFRKLAARRN